MELRDRPKSGTETTTAQTTTCGVILNVIVSFTIPSYDFRRNVFLSYNALQYKYNTSWFRLIRMTTLRLDPWLMRMTPLGLDPWMTRMTPLRLDPWLMGMTPLRLDPWQMRMTTQHSGLILEWWGWHLSGLILEWWGWQHSGLILEWCWPLADGVTSPRLDPWLMGITTFWSDP